MPRQRNKDQDSSKKGACGKRRILHSNQRGRVQAGVCSNSIEQEFGRLYRPKTKGYFEFNPIYDNNRRVQFVII